MADKNQSWGGRFSEGYPVGRVVSVKRDSGQPFAEIAVEPLARLERNREVLLVWSNAAGQFVDSAFRLDGGGPEAGR